MFLKYFLIFILNTGPGWSYLVLSPHKLQGSPVSFNSAEAEERLILTPYISAGNIKEARNLAVVESLFPDPSIISYSGYLTVDEKHSSNLFMWFFQQHSDQWQKAPLVLWLQGGPGCTSLYSLFEETGPYTVTKSGLKARNSSWTNNYNVLYIDQPVGTGFSFTDKGYISNQVQVADHLYIALTQFFQLFPELKQNDFYISGESYAGKYIPAISYKIHKLRQAGKSDINLKGLFMVAPYTNGLLNGLADFCFEIGIVDSKTKVKLEQQEQLTKSLILSKMWVEANNSWNAFHEGLYSNSSVLEYDYTKSYLDNEYYSQFVQKASTRQKIHVGNTAFSNCSYEVNKYFTEDFTQSVVPWIEELIEHYPIAFIGGQYDISVAYPLILNVMKNLSWSGAFEYSQAERKKFTSAGKVVGYYKSAGHLKDVLMRNSGHMVPYYQPQGTLDLLDKFIKNEL